MSTSPNPQEQQEIAGEVVGFFDDPTAASSVALVRMAQQIEAPLVKGTVLDIDEVESGGGVRVVMLVIDESGTMAEVGQMLRDGFNNDFVPAIKAAREDDITALRIGGIAFSDDSKQIWRGPDGTYFHKLEELPNLTTAEYFPEHGGMTALHGAIFQATAIANRYAADLQRTGADDVDVDILIMSDGRNNRTPPSSDEVKQLIAARDKRRVRYGFFYFDTSQGFDQFDAKDYAQRELGIDPEMIQSFATRPNETEAERSKRFRRMLNIISRVSAQRRTTAVVAVGAVPDDEELV